MACGLAQPTRIGKTGTISAEAQRFLDNSMEAKWEPVDLTPAGVQLLRLENSQVAAPGCSGVQTELGTVTKDAFIAGIPAQWVTPKQTFGPEIVLYLFGGGFVCGSPEDDLSISARLAAWMNRRVCVPRYRLAPENPFPVARNDVMTVYNTLSESYNVVVVGESAGGNLALELVLDLLAEGLCSPLAVALLSPWADLSHSGKSHQLSDLDPTLSVEHFLKPASLAYIGDKSPTMPSISPLFANFPANFPPTTISTGTRDLLQSDSILLASKLRERNIIVDLQVTEGLWHVFEWYPDLPEASESLHHIASFLSKYLVKQTK